jgi:hypothetical protein
MENKFFNPLNFYIGMAITCAIVLGHISYIQFGWYSVFIPLGFLAMFGIGYIVSKIFKLN